MCGICGIISFDKTSPEESTLRRMMGAMKHRGPDDEGIFIEENIALGFIRLSIIDLSDGGHQPMVSKDERYVLVFNGEIFNYLELKEELINEGVRFYTKSDSEVLLNAYITWGEECLSRFNGMWSFIIYDRELKTIFGSRDRFGIKPFYYLHKENFFAFASEIPSLLTLLKSKPQPDYQSIFDYLVFNRTDQTENTFFSEIKKLQHGHTMRLHLGPPSKGVSEPVVDFKRPEIIVKRWYNLSEKVKASKGFENPEEFRQLFASAVGLRLRSDVPVGVCLSGGLDSSSIASVLLKDYKKEDLNAFSAVYENGATGDESEYIREYSSQLSNMFFTSPSADSLIADLRDFVIAQAEPIPSTSPYAHFKVMELAKGNVVVTLDGQGADEELAGYHYFYGFLFKDLLKKVRIGSLCYEIFFYLKRHKSLYGIKTFLYFLLPQRTKAGLRVREKNYLNARFAEKHLNNNSIAGNLYGSGTLKDALIDHFEFKLEHLLKWEDRNSMWFSLESRVPFLDYRLVERTLATPGELIIKKGWTKFILRESMKGTLPEKIRMRVDKTGFDTPQDAWFRTPEWRKIVGDILDSESFADRGIIDVGRAKEILADHLSGKRNSAKELWKWVHLELWFRTFID